MTCVFIGHEASLTGAPFAQLYLLQWLRANTTHRIELVLLRGGALQEEFEKVANVHVVSDYIPAPTLRQRLLRKASSLINLRVRRIFNTLAKQEPCLIFANTAPALEFAVEVKRLLKVPLLISIHELEAFFFSHDANRFAEYSKEIDFFIPCSKAVKTFYQSFCPLPESKTQVVYDFSNRRTDWVSTAADVRREYGIPADAKVVGAGGSLGWRKGVDLFLQVAHSFKKAGRDDVYFIWVGGDPQSTAFKETLHDIRLMGLAERVLFVGTKKDLQGFYEAFDVFLLTSREDPFPLVCMEASLLGCPIICFENAGGMPEFVRDDAGFVVPYADVLAMSEKTSYLLANAPVRSQMSAVAQQRAENHHTIRNIGPEMYEIMQRFMK